MENYYCFTENNDWEGESWNFYIPMTTDQAKNIKKIVNKYDDAYGVYEMDDETVYTEKMVDKLVKKGQEGYMWSNNKCEPLTDEQYQWILKFKPEDDDLFYKAQIWKIISR